MASDAVTTQANPDGGSATGVLPAIRIKAASDDPAHDVNPPTTVGSKIPVAQREMAQSVSVVTQQQIQQQNLVNTDDVVRTVPGVTVNNIGGGFSSYFSRGFPITTYMLDGVPTQIINGSEIAGLIAMYDRVEVLRGPAGLLNGFGGDGGVINFVRKTAPSQFEASAQVQVGTYDTRSAQVDIGGPLNQAGTLRGRVVAMQQDQDLNQHGTWQRDKQLYGTLEADITPTTLVRIGGSYTDTAGKLMYNVPALSNNQLMDIPVSTYLGADWNYTTNETINAFAQVEQKLAAGWKAKLSYEHQQTNSSQIAGIAGGPVDATTGIGDLYSFNYADNNTQDSIDLNASGPFRLFGRTHQLTIGANYTHQSDNYYRYFIDPAVGGDALGDTYANVFDNSAYLSSFDGPRQIERTVTQQYGIYANARFNLADRLTLVTGGRVTWWKSALSVPDDAEDNWWGMSNTNDHINGKFTPFVGLIYDINNNYSAYASYTSIFVPQTGDYSVSGQIIKPVTGEQYEVGVKGEYWGGKLNTSLALFQITEKNRAMADPLNPGYDVAQGKARSRGVEATASGEVLPNLTVSGGYTYTQADNLDSSTNALYPFSITTPKHLFKLWANYRLPDRFNKWSVGGGTYVSSGTYYTNSTGEVVAPGYATFDAKIGYQINKHLSAALNVSNIFNKKYYSTVTTNGNVYGDPVKVFLTLRAQM